MNTIIMNYTYGEEERELAVQVVYSARRTLGLEVSRDGSVKARAPEWMSDAEVLRFVREKQGWILEKAIAAQTRLEAAEENGVPDYVRRPELENKYRRQAKARLAERVFFFAKQMGVTYGTITVRSTKTRWGSCSGRGNLNFHWKLILMPPEILDYVVVHELAHRKQMNHSAAFWKEVETVLPDYQKRRSWLKTYGSQV